MIEQAANNVGAPEDDRVPGGSDTPRLPRSDELPTFVSNASVGNFDPARVDGVTAYSLACRMSARHHKIINEPTI